MEQNWIEINYEAIELFKLRLGAIKFEWIWAVGRFDCIFFGKWVALNWITMIDSSGLASISIGFHPFVPFRRRRGCCFTGISDEIFWIRVETKRKVEKWMKRGKRSKRASEAEEEGRMKVVSKRRRRLDASVASVASVVNPFHQQKNPKESTRIPEIRHRWPTDGGENAGKISQVCCQCCRKTDERIPKESWMNWRGIDRYVRW